LTTAKGGVNGALWTQNYAYDRFGNRTNVAASGVAADNSAIPLDGTPNLSYDTTSNRITTTGYQYDAAGNQTRAKDASGNWIRMYYDYANRLEMITDDSGNLKQAYQFSPSGSRLMNTDYTTNQTTFYANTGGTTLAEYVEFTYLQPTWTKSYTYFGDSLLSTINNANGVESIEFNHPDQLGTRTITNQQLGTSYEQKTLPFGTALNAESTVQNNNKRFTSYDRSPITGLDYAVNRTYDSKQGRFTQVDPLGMGAVSLGSPQTLNLYAYCGNDPINHTDPSGLFWGSLFKAIFKIFTSKWFRVAVAVAITVLSAGAAGALIIANFVAVTVVTTSPTPPPLSGEVLTPSPFDCPRGAGRFKIK
jgi:RHS repeat-associated protein